MRNRIITSALMMGALSLSLQATAGNKDRVGQAGASELLINPWARSSGLFGMNVSNVTGIEAMKVNIAGLSHTDGTEVGLAHTIYLRGAKVNVNNLAIGQRLGDFGVIGANIMAMSFGEIPITTYDNPEGQVGTYKPQFFNVSLGFAKEFSNSVRAGIGATFISEQISDINASGAVFEAGVQYITGKRDNFHFGITLRNIGTGMSFAGDGFAFDSEAPANELYSIRRSTPSEEFEMPTYLTFGAAYDFYLDENRLAHDSMTPKHRATVIGNFQSNSFNNDYFGLGVEYSFREMFMLRAAYRYENDITDAQNSTTFYTGLAAGATVQYQIGEDGPTLAIDYAYRPTQRPANGVHTISLRFMR